MEVDSDPKLDVASTLLVQNLVRLCSDLRLPVAYKVNEVEHATGGGDTRTFYIIVHVLADNAFKKYLQHCSQSDLMLFRGMLLKVTTSADLKQLHSAQVQQAFLPKFENEGQDSSVADAIVSGATSRFMVVTIKHSGSLVTLSGAQGFAAKNSLDNEFTAGAAALLNAHYLRLAKGDAAAAQARLAGLMATLRERRMALSFEMVTGCHGHHGQLPAAEYLVTTSAHTIDPASGRPTFLPWQQFMTFCLEQGLPVNDTWLLAGTRWAGAARDALDDLALRGGPTATALGALNALTDEGRSDGCLHLPGTYPHDQWQGSRIEGFVVSQGQSTDPASTAALEQLLPSLRGAVLPLGAVPEPLRQPYRQLAQQYPGDSQAVQEQVLQACRGWLPARKLNVAAKDEKDKVVALLSAPLPQVAGSVQLALPSGEALYSRLSLAASPADTFRKLAEGVDRGQGQGQGQQGAALLKLLTQAAEAAKGGGGSGKALPDAEHKVLMVQLLRNLAGAPEVHHTLRYKKKMTMWSFGSAPAPSQQGGDAAAADAPAADAVMGYCMMTFVIRNGIRALSLGPETYYSYVSSLVRNWGLPKRSEAQVQLFARAWAAWVEQHGGAGRLQDGSYLDFAEPFVFEFLRRRGEMPMAGVVAQRPEGAFQGVLLLADTPPGLAKRVQERLHAHHLYTLDKQAPPFTKAMARQGMVVWSPEGTPLPKNIQVFVKESAPYLFLGVQGTVPGGQGVEPTTKKQKQAGGQSLKTRPFEQELGALPEAARRNPPRKRVLQALPADVRTAAANASASAAAAAIRAGMKAPGQAAAPAAGAGAAAAVAGPPPAVIKAFDSVAAEIEQWLGQGVPVPLPDPAVVCCFITMPGTGKTVLTEGLKTADALAGYLKGPGGKGAGVSPMECDGAADGGSAFTSLQVKVLNSDTMKAVIPGFKASRFWPEVSDAADTSVGSGSVTLVVADKNLVPSPRGNLEKALKELSDSGASTLAVLPCCTGMNSQELLPHLYQGMQDLPMPLEFIALCMMRVLNRRKHEGKLDAESCKEAASVVAMFAAFYRNLTYSSLRQQVQTIFGSVIELPIMQGIGSLLPPGTPPGAAAGAALPAKLQETLAHVAAGVSKVDSRSGPGLSPEWEQRARQLLADTEVSAALQSLQRPLGDLQAEVASAIVQRLAATAAARAQRAAPGGAAGAGPAGALQSEASQSADLQLKLNVSDTAAAAAAAGGAQVRPAAAVRWFGVAGLDVQGLLDHAKSLPLAEDVRKRISAGRPNYHITLWHMDDQGQQPGAREALMAAVGQEVAVEVVAIDTSPEVTAAQVQLLGAPDEVMTKSYHHITLAVGPKSAPKDANKLPERVADGSAQRFTLPEPLQLVGQILAFTEPSRPEPVS